MTADRKERRGKQLQARDSELIYGLHSATAALRNSQRMVHAVWVTQNMSERIASLLAERRLQANVVHPRDIDKITGSNAVHQGIALKATPLPAPSLEEVDDEGLVIVLDQVTDPHNVGAILRTCAAFNVKAMVTTARHSPDGSSVMTKSASGALEVVPIIKVTNLARALEHLAVKGFTLIGLDSEAELSLENVELAGPYAIVLGAEGRGLRKLTRTKCDVMARIDLPGSLVSLNVSNAAALALYALTCRT